MKTTAIISVLYLAALATGYGNIITFDSLLDEMVDRDEVAKWPQPFYTCKQFSSYDRATVAPDQPGWYANKDFSHFVTREERDGRTEWVMMDAEGPGCIVRIWCTWHQPVGTIRFYLDGSETPVIEGNVGEIISGGQLAGRPLSADRSRGHDLYVPIPYAQRCKVTWDGPNVHAGQKGKAFYYQVNYRSYPAGTKVASFSQGALLKGRKKLAAVQSLLARSLRAPAEHEQEQTFSATLGPNESHDVSEHGQKAIHELALKIHADDMEQALRSTILDISFDGKQTAWCPVGDFFGTGHQLNPYHSWYTEVVEDGTMACRWVMPFRESARVTVRNLGKQPVRIVYGHVRSAPWTWDDRSLYFHSTWRHYPSIQSKRANGLDVNFVEIAGTGKYVGDTLTIFNGASAWWGEGDEKIYVDEEAFPSHIGTGSEDYYGYAWCNPAFFEAPFHAQPLGDGNKAPAMSVNSRYRSLDAIPFKTSLRFDMELWHWAGTRLHYTPTTFWYARPGTSCNVKPLPQEAKRPVPRSQDDVNPVMRVEGAIEAEGLKIAEKTGGETEHQTWKNDIWSGGKQVWWKNGNPGDRLVFEVPVEQGGSYDVLAQLTKAPDYAIVKITVNGTVLSEELDLYHPEVVARRLKLGRAELRKGKNRLEITLVGANNEAKKAFMFGLDYLILQNGPDQNK